MGWRKDKKAESVNKDSQNQAYQPAHEKPLNNRFSFENEVFDISHTTHFEPNSYSDIQEIADALIRFRKATVNFAKLTSEDKVRVIDFLTGVMYGLDGDYRKLDNKIYQFILQH
ncbi:cell division protein SepF [Spiroplasma endosymbiont of Panorpa germanica]|uniref:cell division protein SepF n=1 Tax=Spiroplasma endosymbiont of Panorpa germanica TaxID=3066314 RepID=UPI0030D4F4F0